MSVLYLADTVGIDGTVYPTIGEHIRSVDKDVNVDTYNKAPAIIKKETGKNYRYKLFFKSSSKEFEWKRKNNNNREEYS